MSFTLFKPNNAGTGSILNANFKSKGKIDRNGNQQLGNGFFNIKKQISGDVKSSVFKNSKTGDFNQVSVALSVFELSGVLKSIRTNTEWVSNPHTTEQRSTTIFFQPGFSKKKENNKWVKVGDQKGFRLVVAVSSEGKKSSYNINLSFDEAEALAEYIKFALQHIFTAKYAFDKKQFQENHKQQNNLNTRDESDSYENEKESNQEENEDEEEEVDESDLF